MIHSPHQPPRSSKECHCLKDPGPCSIRCDGLVSCFSVLERGREESRWVFGLCTAIGLRVINKKMKKHGHLRPGKGPFSTPISSSNLHRNRRAWLRDCLISSSHVTKPARAWYTRNHHTIRNSPPSSLEWGSGRSLKNVKMWERVVDGRRKCPLRAGLVFKAHRLVYHSTLGLSVMTKKKSVHDSDHDLPISFPPDVVVAPMSSEYGTYTPFWPWLTGKSR